MVLSGVSVIRANTPISTVPLRQISPTTRITLLTVTQQLRVTPEANRYNNGMPLPFSRTPQTTHPVQEQRGFITLLFTARHLLKLCGAKRLV